MHVLRASSAFPHSLQRIKVTKQQSASAEWCIREQTPNMGSGPDLGVGRSSPCLRLCAQQGVCWRFFPSAPPPALSLSNKKLNLEKEKQLSSLDR